MFDRLSGLNELIWIWKSLLFTVLPISNWSQPGDICSFITVQAFAWVRVFTTHVYLRLGQINAEIFAELVLMPSFYHAISRKHHKQCEKWIPFHFFLDGTIYRWKSAKWSPVYKGPSHVGLPWLSHFTHRFSPQLSPNLLYTVVPHGHPLLMKSLAQARIRAGKG